MNPLQSHGLYDTVWYPPGGGRFIGFDKSDEVWMRELGLGTTKRELKPLYDVRVGDDAELVGYTRHNPANCKVRAWVFPVREKLRIMLEAYRDDKLRMPVDSSVEVRPGVVAVDFRKYLCWQVEDSDVGRLKQTAFLEIVSGDCRLREFIREKRRAMANENRSLQTS